MIFIVNSILFKSIKSRIRMPISDLYIEMPVKAFETDFPKILIHIWHLIWYSFLPERRTSEQWQRIGFKDDDSSESSWLRYWKIRGKDQRNPRCKYQSNINSVRDKNFRNKENIRYTVCLNNIIFYVKLINTRFPFNAFVIISRNRLYY